jgi:signal transduction histidine kinase
VTAHGAILYANPSCLELLGASADDVVGLELDALLVGRDDLEARSRAVRAPDGSDALLVELHDVGQERRISQELADLAVFPEMNPGPVLRLDLNGTILVVNPAARRVFGEEGLVGSHWLERIPGLDEATWTRIVGGEEIEHEAAVGDAWYLLHHMRSPDGTRVFVFGADITARRAAEQQVREIARFPDMNPGPVLRVDLEGTVLLANRAAREVCGADLVDTSWLDIYPASRERWPEITRTEGIVHLETSLGGRDYVFAHRADRQSGLVFIYGTDITQQRKAEQALRQSERMATLGTLAAGVAHELNNPAAATRRAAEQLRDALARLEEAYRLLQAMGLDDASQEVIHSLDEQARTYAAASTSLGAMDQADREAEVEAWLDHHGVEDPWNLAPALVAQGLEIDRLDQIADSLTGQALAVTLRWVSAAFPVYRLAHEIGRGSSRISEIVGALKSYTFMDEAPEQDVDLHAALDNTLVMVRHKLKDGVTVRREYSPDLPPVPAYGSELNQVWTNVLDNAADALAGTGTITIRTSARDGWAIVEIEDDGPGIPESAQPHLFDPFFTTKEPGQGTGLGLSTAYTIVTERHDGEISVTSRPGATRFTVRLPLRSPHPPRAPVT